MKNCILILALSLFSFAPEVVARSVARSFDTLEMKPEGDIYFGMKVSFSGTTSNTASKIWYPVEPAKVWPVLIDTNAWKEIHKGTYADARTLNQKQFDAVLQNKPDTIKAFESLVGTDTSPSDLGRKKGGVWTSYTFQRFAFPFPLKDRWAVLKIKNDETQASKGMYRYDYEMVAGNFKSLKGYWELSPLDEKPGWTEFGVEYSSDPGISVPHFMAKSIFRSSLKREAKENLAQMKK